MSDTFNIYCDESCHLENDKQKAMVLGAIWCPKDQTKQFNQRIKEIKIEHNINPNSEIKWTKVSPGKLPFYLDLVNYFFDNQELHFRGLVVPDKSVLNHSKFNNSHNDWYYRMYFDMIKTIIVPTNCYSIYLDIKDTVGGQKVTKLREVLCNDKYDFNKQIIEKIQLVRSDEINLLQLADLLIGAVSYINRGLSKNCAKTKLIEKIQERSGYTLNKTTLSREEKVNLLIWNHQYVETA